MLQGESSGIGGLDGKGKRHGHSNMVSKNQLADIWKQHRRHMERLSGTTTETKGPSAGTASLP